MDTVTYHPKRRWLHIAIDFVTDMPVSKGYTTVPVAIDPFSKGFTVCSPPSLPDLCGLPSLLLELSWSLLGLQPLSSLPPVYLPWGERVPLFSPDWKSLLSIFFPSLQFDILFWYLPIWTLILTGFDLPRMLLCFFPNVIEFESVVLLILSHPSFQFNQTLHLFDPFWCCLIAAVNSAVVNKAI